jgi:hypothetical protein
VVAVFTAVLAFGSSVFAQAPLQNGVVTSGNISPAGHTDTWTFTAKAGDSIMVRVGSTNFTPNIQLFGPSNNALTNTTSGNGLTRDGYVAWQASASGTYTVLVSASFTGQTGTYGVTLADAPESFAIAPGESGGVLTNGVLNGGTLPLGVVDIWSFTASANDSCVLRVGSTNFTPWIQVYDPNGSLVGSTNSGNGLTRDEVVQVQTSNSGTYTVFVSATFQGQSGGYGLTLAQALEPFVIEPGQTGGALVNGILNQGTLPLGALDVWRFTAKANDNFVLRVGSTNFTPWLLVYGPNGSLVASTNSGNGLTRDGLVAAQATASGDYTVVLSATYQGQNGDYGITLAQAPESFAIAPGQSGGVLANGALNGASLPLGGMDLWSFAANAKDNLILRVGSTNFTPWIQVYDPTGALVGNTTSGNGLTRDGNLALQATSSGTYTVVLSATFPGQFGDYGITLAQAPEPFVIAPGQSGGVLTNGVLNGATLPLGGMDMWSFAANAKDNFVLRVGSTNFTPTIQVYDPTGALAGSTTSGNGLTRDGNLALQATNSGTYTVVLSATFQGQFGDYGITLAQSPAPFVIAPGQSGGALINGFLNVGTLPLGGLTMWSFFGTPGDSNVLRVVSTNFTPWIQIYGPDGALVAETTSGNGLTRAGSVSLIITNGGTYNVLLSATFQGQFGTFSLKESRVPPDLIVPDTQTLDELSTVNVSISAQDPDIPTKPLQFALLSGPSTMTLALAGATNANLSWLTTEADGPSTNTIVVTVTDQVGKGYTRTNSFTVIVREVNKPPVLPIIFTQTVNELTTLTVTNAATEPDPKSVTTGYTLVNAPAGGKIDANGVFQWTPQQTQSPSTNTITTVVTNSNPFDLIRPQLTATNSFTVVVQEVNVAPTLAVIPPQTVNEQTLLTVTNTATESNIHSATTSYALVSAPPGVKIDASGVITWTPTQDQSPSTNTITTIVLNSNPFDLLRPQLPATNSFTVVVKEVNQAPVLLVIPTQSVRAYDLLIVTNNATEPNIHSTTAGYGLFGSPAGVKIDANGVITWTPSQVPSATTNIITTVVTNTNPYDTLNPQLTATNSFAVLVKPIATPVLQSISDKTVQAGKPLSVQASATDPDRPTATLTFSLDPGAPTNMTINAASGLIAWTPTAADVGTHAVTVRATDNGSPPLNGTTAFNVIVTGQGPTLGIQGASESAGQLQIELIISGDTGHFYELERSSDLRNWSPVVQVNLQTSPSTQTDTEPTSAGTLFYRLRLVQ